MPLWLPPALKSRLLHYGLLALACALLWARGNAWERAADSWRTAFNNQKAAYEAAQHAAAAKAIAAKLAAEASYSTKARGADNEYQNALDRAQRAADAYARRVRAEATGGSPSGPPSPAKDRGPEGPERSGPDAVVLGRDDFDILVENSVRLEAAHQWAKTLNVAVPEPEFGAD